MSRLDEIKARKLEIKGLLEDETKEVDIEKLTKEIEDLDAEERSIIDTAKVEDEKEKEERKVKLELAKKLEESSVGKVIERKEDEKMKTKYTIASPEYRTAWAKKIMGLSEDKFTEEEKRALGDAVITTDTTFVASSEDVNGINNGGLLIPTSIRTELLELISEQSPFFRDIRKLQVAGNVDLPYLFSSDDASWYTEVTDTDNEGQEYKNLQLTGWDLAKDIVITWKAEEMSVKSFIDFILEELSYKMGRALINACLYGTGVNQPTGVTVGLTPIAKSSDETVIDLIITAYKSLSQENRIGAKAYVSTNVNLAICGYKDENGNYPFLQGLKQTSMCPIETDPFLKDDDIVIGNARYYVLNEVSPVRVDKEKSVKTRKVIYGAYGIYDSKAKPGAFTYAQNTATV